MSPMLKIKSDSVATDLPKMTGCPGGLAKRAVQQLGAVGLKKAAAIGRRRLLPMTASPLPPGRHGKRNVRAEAVPDADRANQRRHAAQSATRGGSSAGHRSIDECGMERCAPSRSAVRISRSQWTDVSARSGPHGRRGSTLTLPNCVRHLSTGRYFSLNRLKRITKVGNRFGRRPAKLLAPTRCA